MKAFYCKSAVARTGSVFFWALLVPGTLAADPSPDRFTFTDRHMGTLFKLICYAPDKPTADKAARAVFERVAQLDQCMSDYKADSELMQLCRKAGGPPVTVSEDLFTVLAKAQEISKLSDGAFDVTVGPVVKLWRRSRRTLQLPPAEQLARARELVGYQNVKLDPKARTVQLLKPGMLLDLGGIAKGYAADQALRKFKEFDITRALVAASGDIAVGDSPPDAEGWNVGIAPLEDPDAKPARYLLLKNAAVSTSGDAEQYVEIGGKRYSHILDPRTGVGLVGRLSATVVARHGILADSLTKVVAVLGPERGLAVIDSLHGPAALLVRKIDKGEESYYSRKFREIPHK